jgi:hypothetical protein
MREVIRIEEGNSSKKLELTHLLSEDSGWIKYEQESFNYDKIVYLGRCNIDGDMFAVYYQTGMIGICKGHVNSGRYE